MRLYSVSRSLKHLEMIKDILVVQKSRLNGRGCAFSSFEIFEIFEIEVESKQTIQTHLITNRSNLSAKGHIAFAWFHG